VQALVVSTHGLNEPQFLPQAILTRKVGQNDLIFGVRSEFISVSVHARLQACAVVMVGETHTHICRQTQRQTDRQTAF